MEWAAFGLARDPFQRVAELDDACLPNTVSALLSELLSSLRSPQGVSVLAGEAGSGKSMAAAAFARRAGGTAHVAYLPTPTSSVAAIARDALAELDPDDYDFTAEEDWVPAFRAWVERATRAGRATVVLLDDAHRLSPQTLEDLAEYFAEDETLRLHVFLFGRPKLLDRLQSGAEEALTAHVLQICRLEPLGVRESVRYLERRIAICGGELTAILSDEAIDEIVQKAEGCVIRLEELTVEALCRASRKGAPRATVVDVVATARAAEADEEDEVMAGGQQPLSFAIDEDSIDEETVSWGDEDDERSVEWGDESSGEEEEWHADDEDEEEEWESDDEEEPDLRWEASPPRAQLEASLAGELDDHDDEDDEEEEPVRPRRSQPSPSLRRRLAGPAVLTLGACFALVWAANQLPGSDGNEKRGRDSVMFAERLSSKPNEIMRLARTAEAADADAHVDLWKDQPPRLVATKPPAPVAKAAEPVLTASTKAEDLAAKSGKTADAAPAAADELVGPHPQRPAEIEVAAPAARPVDKTAAGPVEKTVAKKSAVAPVAKAKTPAGKPAATAAAKKKDPVYTVQLGAFKARRNAEEMVTRLRGKSPRILQEGGLYRVMSGSFESKREAALHEASLKRAGYTTYVRTVVF